MLALAGRVEPEGRELLKHGASAVIPIAPETMSPDEAQARALELLSHAAEQAMRRWASGSAFQGTPG